MSKLFSGICIFFLLALIVGGWYLGQVQSYLAIRDSELLSMKQELERTQQELDKTQQKLEQAQPRHFNSLEELETWLAKDDTNQLVYSSDEFNCINFALMLQERALADGYILSTEVLPVAAHWVNLAVINDKIYLIEPQDDEIILEKQIPRYGKENE